MESFGWPRTQPFWNSLSSSELISSFRRILGALEYHKPCSVMEHKNFSNKTKDWALVQNAAWVGVEVKLGLVR